MIQKYFVQINFYRQIRLVYIDRVIRINFWNVDYRIDLVVENVITIVAFIIKIDDYFIAFEHLIHLNFMTRVIFNSYFIDINFVLNHYVNFDRIVVIDIDDDNIDLNFSFNNFNIVIDYIDPMFMINVIIVLCL